MVFHQLLGPGSPPFSVPSPSHLPWDIPPPPAHFVIRCLPSGEDAKRLTRPPPGPDAAFGETWWGPQTQAPLFSTPPPAESLRN